MTHPGLMTNSCPLLTYNMLDQPACHFPEGDTGPFPKEPETWRQGAHISSPGFGARRQASREDRKDAGKLVGFLLCISWGGVGVGSTLHASVCCSVASISGLTGGSES